jgi:hypothetical protein
MNERFTIPADDAQAYSLMRTYGISDDELKDFIANMLGEIKILADYAKFAGVAGHVQAALEELASEKLARVR